MTETLDDRDVKRLLARFAKLNASNRAPSGKPDPAFQRLIAGAILGTRNIGDTVTLLLDGKRLPKLAAPARRDLIEQLDHEGYLWLLSHKIALKLYHLGKLRPWYLLKAKTGRASAEKLFRKLGIPLQIAD